MATLEEPAVRPKGLAGIRPLSVKSGFLLNKSNRPGDDMKEALRTDGDTEAWQAWSTTLNQIWQHTPTCSTLGVSGRTRDLSLTCIPKSGRKNKSFLSIYPHSGWMPL